MPTSIASQLRAIKSSVQGSAAAPRRPAIRPSIIFDPKEAADIDRRTILPIALSGLEVLVERDSRFEKYKATLYSHTSLELDRETMPPKDEEKLKSSIRSYLRLLAGHLHLPAALKTLEYLIRRYLVHMLDMDELVLCAMPYHDTHAFVRIVQLLDLGNGNWAFLEGVKASGAPAPRKVIVQQCIRDKGVLEAFCSYASPVKDFQPPKAVICFCTVVIVEALGSVPKIETDIVNRVISFVFDGLNPALKGSRDHKAGALMVAGLLATRATLSSKLAHNLVFVTARMAQHDAKEFLDLSWLRVSVTAIITLVKLDSVQTLPKKTVMILNEIRDFVGILSGLSQEFNIQKFLSLYVETLAENSQSDASSRLSLISTIEALPMKELIDKIVAKIFAYSIKLSKSMDQSNFIEAVKWVKPILLVSDKHYPQELQRAVHKFLETSKMDLKDNDPTFHALRLMLDGSSGMPVEISDSKILLSLEHPKASVRQAALTNLSTSDILTNMDATSKMLTNDQDAIVRRLHDDDLRVVQAALSIDGLAGIIDPSILLKSYSDLLLRCMDIISKSLSAVQLQSLRLFATFCSTLSLSESSRIDEKFILQLLLAFPRLLVPLCSTNKDTREAAVNCTEGLQILLMHFIASRSKNGSDTILSCSISISTVCVFLDSIITQRQLIVSDVNFLASYLPSLLCPSAPGLLVPENTQKSVQESPMRRCTRSF